MTLKRPSYPVESSATIFFIVIVPISQGGFNDQVQKVQHDAA